VRVAYTVHKRSNISPLFIQSPYKLCIEAKR
jgi:hypothetical protein